MYFSIKFNVFAPHPSCVKSIELFMCGGGDCLSLRSGGSGVLVCAHSECGGHLVVRFGVDTQRAEVTAPSCREVRDAFALYRVFTRLLAVVKARAFSR